MELVLHTLDHWTTYQDYLWFLAALAWVGVAIGLGRPNRRQKEPWYLAWAVANLASAGIELALLSIDDRTDQYWMWDRLMAAALGASAAAVLMAALAMRLPTQRRATALVLAVSVALAVTWWRNRAPIVGGFGMALVCAFAVRGLAAAKGQTHDPPSRLRGALSVFIFWPLLATHGPLAHATGPGRIGEDYSRFALVAAATLAFAGLLAARAVWHERLVGIGDFRANLRRHLLGLGVWLLFGFALVIVSGALARRDYEDGLRARVQTAAMALDPRLLERAMGPALQTGWFEWRQAGGGTRLEVMHTPTAGRPEFVALRDALARLETVNPDVRYSYLVTLRGQRVIIVMAGGNEEPTLQRLLVMRPATPDDFARLHEKKAIILGPLKDTFGERIVAQSPVYGPAGKAALGWLVFQVPASRWLAVFAQARLLAMSIVAVGALLWAALLGHELRRFATEAEARRAAAAVETDRLKSAFLAMVSHELRTPIQSVLGYTELLAGENLPPTPMQWIAALRSHGQTMHRLVNDLIDTGTLQSGTFHLRPGPARLRGIVENALAAIRPAALAKGLRLHSEFDESLPPTVLCDAVRVRQILVNLLANAVKFTAAGEVALHAQPAPAGPGVEFTVRDTGPGIPECDRPTLFQPFARLGAPENIEGTGLGLALVARLCQSMGGRVDFQPGESAGAVFTVTLPLPTASDREIPADTQSLAPSTAWQGVPILVAEDNRLVRELLVAFLSRHGAAVVAVADGPAALAALRERAFVVALLDWMLPGRDGLAVTRALRASRAPGADVFVIGLSAHANDHASAEARAAGVNVFLPKPVDLVTLAGAIAQAPGMLPLPHSRIADDTNLVARLQSAFALELPALLEAIAERATARDWPRLQERVHYLKNSADVAGAVALGRLCQRVLDDREPKSAAGFQAIFAELAATSRHPFAPSGDFQTTNP